MIPAHLQNRTLEELRATQETIRCFLVKPTGEGYESVVVFEDGQCIAGWEYHRSEKVIRRFPLGPNETYPSDWASDDVKALHVPRYCTRCGNYEFSKEAIDRAGGSKGRVWEREDTGERADNLNAFGPGAMWYATWYRKDETGEYFNGGRKLTEPPLIVRTPGGDWDVDSRCSNCTLPDDTTHACWPRRGIPPKVTVDKSIGPTCNAGGGSVMQAKWHGFLRDGFLVKC